jgi:hypothetical protein
MAAAKPARDPSVRIFAPRIGSPRLPERIPKQYARSESDFLFFDMSLVRGPSQLGVRESPRRSCDETTRRLPIPR